jgi:glycosyltransferase involved in cell wall biosynthesis
MNPKLSIIVPIYNAESYLEECLQSVFSQSFVDFELILVDDGSTDGSPIICDEYSTKDVRIRIARKKNGGVSSARNFGLSLVRGDYVAFVDSDDTLSVDAFAQNMQFLLDDPSIDLLEFPVSVSCNTSAARIWQVSEGHAFGGEAVFRHWVESKGYLHAYLWNKIYKRTLFEGIVFPEGQNYEDVYMLPTLLRKVSHAYFSPAGLYNYYSRDCSITKTHSLENLTNHYKSNSQILVLMEECSGLKSHRLILYLNTINTLVDIHRAIKSKNEKSAFFVEGVKSYPLTLVELFGLDVPLVMKFKNVTLCLLGWRWHCRLFSFLKSL